VEVVAVELVVEKLFGSLSRLILWLNLSLSATIAFAADFSPIIPLPSSGSDLPLLDLALRDPELASRRLTDDIYVQRTLEEVDAQTRELSLAKGSRRLELLSDLYKNHALLAYFFEDMKAGRLTAVQGNYGSPEQKLGEARAAVIRYATDFARESKERRAHAIYHAMVAKYLNGQTRKPDALLKISKQLSKGLQARVEFMVAAARAQRNDTEAKQDIARVSNRLGSAGIVAGNLLLARAEAARNNEAYRTHLNRATASTKSLARRDREKVLAYAVNIWRREEGSRADWSKAPLNMKINRDTDVAKAVTERSALQASTRGKLTPALRYYRGMIEVSKGSSRLTQVTDRILDLEAAQYASSKNVKPYQKALISFQQMYETGGILGQNQDAGKAAAEKVRLRHRNLISQMIAQGKNPSSDRKTKANAIAAANVYLDGQAVENEKVPLRTDIGRLYALNDQHAEAVRVFMALKTESQAAQAQQYLLLAMQSQRVLAKWSEKAPWSGVSKEAPQSRQVLAQMYEERLQTTGSWDDLAHLGLLYVSLNQATKAYGIWTAALQKNTQGPHAQLAAGMMLETYKKARQWQNLENIARLAIKAQLIPVHQNQRLDAVALLGDALFEGGKEHFAATRWENASQKLAEFIKSYRSDFRRPEGMFILGKAYHNDEKHPQSVETIFALVNEYPASRFDHDALLLGGSWAIPMAWEEQTIFFYQRFVDRYARDSKAPQIRMTLVDLYMGRELYGNAVRVHAAHVADDQVSRQEQIKSALAVMHIEERYGEARHAYWGVAKARELSGNNPAVLADVLAFEARQAAAKNDYTKLRQLEAQLSGLGIQSRSASEGLALTRFVLADKEAEETKQEIFNLEQTDPYKTLQAQYAVFLKTKASYEKVCAAGTSSYCGLAMLRLSETTRHSLSAIEDLSIPQTLEASIVQKFETQKLGIINVISQTAAQADVVALGISEKGDTLPVWSQEIVVNSSEGNLDRSHGAIGNGYVQWMPVKTDRD
jgi:TolA-binding protein